MTSFFKTTASAWYLFLLPFAAFAAEGNSNNPGVGNSGNSFELQNPLAQSTFCQLIKAILDVVIQLGVPVIVVFLVIAGARFVWARGNEKKLTDAKANLFYTILGIGIFLGAWALAMIVAGVINQLQPGSISAC